MVDAPFLQLECLFDPLSDALGLETDGLDLARTSWLWKWVWVGWE